MTLAQNRSATIRRTYHPSGKLKTEEQDLHPDFKDSEITNLKSQIAYEYTPEGRLARLTYPDATTVAYEYNARGELARVIDNAQDNQPAVFEYTRRLDGKIESITLPNGAKTTKSYDEVGRLKTIAHLDREGKVLESETSRYDLRNRRTARIKADGSTDLFRYDPAGQVTAAAYGTAAQENPNPVNPANPVNPVEKDFQATQTFRYDPAGNCPSLRSRPAKWLRPEQTPLTRQGSAWKSPTTA
jgi:YD repeat-containing protein